MSVDSVDEIISSGTIPLELEYYSINSLNDDDRKQFGFRTIVRINSPQLGVLYPEQYRIVSNRTSQCVKLSTWAFNKIIDDADKFLSKYPDDFILTIYFPVRMLLKSDIKRLLNSIPQEKKYIIPHLAIEFSSDILLMISPQLIESLNELKSTFNLKLIMSEYGDEFCPVLKLEGLPFDYIILSRNISNPKALSTVSVRSVINIIKNLSMTCMLENTGKRALIDMALESGCDLYCSNRKTNPAGAK